MESDTKNRQSKESILKMLRSAFGEEFREKEVIIKELTEGCFNVAYEVLIPDREMILKISPPGKSGLMAYEDNIMKAEVDALRLVKANTQVPVPEVYYYDETHGICSSDYFFMEKLSGESFSKLRFEGGMPEEKCNELLYELGRLNIEMNRITGENFGYLSQKTKQGSDWKETFRHMLEDILTDGEKIKISLGVSYGEVRRLIDRASFSLKEVTVPRFIHGDLWEGNVFIKEGRIVGIIDFERALWGDPLMENFYRLHCYSESFAKGYGRDLRKEAPVRALLCDMYLYLIMVIETKYRNYPDDGQYRFAVKNLKDAMDRLERLL